MNNIQEPAAIEKKVVDKDTLVEKVDCLRMLLEMEIADTGISYSPGMEIPYIPFFSEAEQKKITTKIFELVEKF